MTFHSDAVSSPTLALHPHLKEGVHTYLTKVTHEWVPLAMDNREWIRLVFVYTLEAFVVLGLRLGWEVLPLQFSLTELA